MFLGCITARCVCCHEPEVQIFTHVVFRQILDGNNKSVKSTRNFEGPMCVSTRSYKLLI
jgi:hypothetical protein